MQPLGAALDVVGVDKEVVEHHEPLQRVCSGERRGQHAESTQADLHGPIERRDDVDGRLGRHLTHRTFPSFASWWQMPPRSRVWMRVVSELLVSCSARAVFTTARTR